MVLIDGVTEKFCQAPVESVGDKAIEKVDGIGIEATFPTVQQGILDEQAELCA